MAVKTKEEILAQIKTVIGERTDDDVITLLEDVADTVDDGKSDWKQKYEEMKTSKDDLEKEWRKKYTDRFHNKNEVPPEDETPGGNDDAPNSETIKIEDLLLESSLFRLEG